MTPCELQGELVTFGFGSRKYIWMLAALIAMQVAQPYLAYESGLGALCSAALLFTVGFAVLIAVLNPGRQRWWAVALFMPVVVVEGAHDVLPEALRFSPSCITSASSHFWRSSLRSSCFDFSTSAFWKSMTSSARLRAT